MADPAPKSLGLWQFSLSALLFLCGRRALYQPGASGGSWAFEGAARAFPTEEKRVDYEAVRAFKQPVLRTAYQSFKEKKQDEDPEYQAFAALDWVKTYTAFRALKKANGGVCWNEWKAEDQNFPEGERELTGEEQEEAGFHTFLQYIFYCQWMKVKTAANEKGIRIMGDVPFYVGLDSADVWGGKDNFLLDTDGRPVFIAGVPPDYFSATGQRWGKSDLATGST